MFGRHVAGDAELVNDFPHTLMSEAPSEDGNALPDERLKVLFAYCHPTLVLETRVALTPWHARRSDQRPDRRRATRSDRDRGGTPRRRTSEVQEGGDPVWCPAGRLSSGATRRCPRDRLSDLQRGGRW